MPALLRSVPDDPAFAASVPPQPRVELRPVTLDDGSSGYAFHLLAAAGRRLPGDGIIVAAGAGSPDEHTLFAMERSYGYRRQDAAEALLPGK